MFGPANSDRLSAARQTFARDPNVIVIEEDRNLLKVHVYGELTRADFREFEDAIAGELKRYPQVDLLLDLRNMTGFTLDAALEEIQFNRQHVGDYKRVAVVTTDQWLTWVSWLAGVFAHAEVERFPEMGPAESWLDASREA